MEQPKNNIKIFEHKSQMATSAEKLMDFHCQPEALSILTPFPCIVQVLADNKESITKGEVDVRIWMGFIPIRWLARHEPGKISTSFKDTMIKGPMGSWTHEHIFEDIEDGAILIDRITLSHRKGWLQLFTRFAFDGIMLRLLFIYRHWRTKRIVSKK